MKIESVVNFITYFAAVIPAVVGLIVVKKLNKTYLLLFFLAVITVIQDIARWSFFEFHIDKLILNFYTIVETVFIALIFLRLISSNKWKYGIKVTLGLLCLFMLLNMPFIEGYYTLNSISMMLESVFLIVLSTKLFLQLSINVPSRSLLKHEMFWFNVGVFSYFSLNFFTFMLSENLFNKTDLDIYGFHLWDIHDVINLIFNLSFAIALWLSSKRKA